MAAALAIRDPLPAQTNCSGTLETQILSLMQLLEDAMEASTEEERANYEALIRSSITGAKHKVDAINGVLAELETREEACAKEIARLQARKQAAAGNAKRLRGYIVAVCAGAGLKKLEGLTSGFSIRNNAAQLEIFNQEELPAEFIDWRIEEICEPNKQKIKAALTAGNEVPGARLVQTQSAVRR